MTETINARVKVYHYDIKTPYIPEILVTFIISLFAYLFHTINTRLDILGPLLFNIFINDIFLYIESSDFCNYPDHRPFMYLWNLEGFMVLSSDKWHFCGTRWSNFIFAILHVMVQQWNVTKKTKFEA